MLKHIALIISVFSASQTHANADLVSRYIWFDARSEFGGISGIEVANDGLTFTALSDRGKLIHGKLVRENGTIVGVESGALIALTDSDANPLSPKEKDTEGLAIAPSGEIYVSFEGEKPLVVRYDSNLARATLIPGHEDFADFQLNSGMEALAIDANGAIYTVPERSGRLTRPFPVYRQTGLGWEQYTEISRKGKFLPAGADFGPDGLFYIVERDFTGIGFRTRVRRFDLEQGTEETVLETGNATHDNLEGIAVWQDLDGAIRLIMIADDNFKWFQQTEIVEYRLTE